MNEKLKYLFIGGGTILLSYVVAYLIITYGSKKLQKKYGKSFKKIVSKRIRNLVLLILFFLLIKIIITTYFHKLPSIITTIINFLIVLIGVYLTVSLIEIFIMHLIRTKTKKDSLLYNSAGIIKVILRVVLYAIGILILLDTAGISITPLLTSLGIGSLAVALALQDTLANFFAGIHLIIDRPIRVGDYIRLESGEEGIVEKIGWRSTAIRTLPNNQIVIPNSKLASSIIMNYSLPEEVLKVVVPIGVSYSSNLEKVEKVALKVAKKLMKEVMGKDVPGEPVVRFKEFGDSSINFIVIFPVKDFVTGRFITHEYIKRIHKEFNKQKIEIPFPIRTVYLKK